MTGDPRWAEAERILEQALELAPEERSAFLDDALAGAGLDDPALRATLDEILAEEERTGFLDPDAMPLRPTFRHLERQLDDASGYPEHVGPYRLLEEIGRGGMARVFLAERVEGGFAQRVAVKLIRRRGDGEPARQRFELERQILAGLGHPAIARLLDGGEVDGRPWFAMELVEGEPVESFCRSRALDLASRLKLFLDVAEAVAYAHRRLVVHRDLKSSNVLVTDAGEVKLLDFGIAKLVEPEAVGLTATDVRPMTPEFASPEQVLGQPVTTASDVYQLGHLLYRLVTDRSPYRGDTATPPHFHQAILTETPILPSQAADLPDPRRGAPGSDPPPPGATATASPSTVGWSSELRGDLDAVVMTALRKEPERRYATVEQLADDVRAVLAGRPVRARPDSLGYRLSKLVSRNRAAFGVAAVALLLLAGSLVLFTLGLARERDRALREAAKAQAIAAFLTETFSASDPNVAGGEEVSARDLLDRGAARIAGEPAGEKDGEPGGEPEVDPEVRAALLETMGLAYRELGLYQPAEELLREALEARTEQLGERHPDTLRSAERLGSIHWRQGRFEEAERLHRHALATASRELGEKHQQTLSHANHLGLDLWRLGRLAEAEELFAATVAAMEETLGDDHVDTLSARNNLAGVLVGRGRWSEAAEVYREVLAGNRRRRGDDHHQTLVSLYNLGLVERHLGRYDLAEPLLAEAVERRRRVFGAEHPATLGSVSALASLYALDGRLDQAVALHRATLETRRRVLGDDHLETLDSLHNLASTHALAGNHDEALSLHRESLEARRRVLGAEHRASLSAAHTLARFLLDLGRLDQAEPLLAETREAYLRTQSADHRLAIEMTRDLGRLRCRRGELDEGEALIRAAIEQARDELDGDAALVGSSLGELGRCLTRAGRLPDAETALLEGHQALADSDTSDAAPRRRVREGLAELYETWGREDAAASWRADDA